MRKQVAALVSATWTKDVISDEDAFTVACLKVSSAFRSCRQNDNISGANDWMECLIEARHYTDEPFAAIYAQHLDAVAATMADWLAGQHKYADAVDVAARTWQAREPNDAQSSGPPSVATTQNRWHLLGVLADIKWRMPALEFRDVVLTPSKHVNAWLSYAHVLQLELELPFPDGTTDTQRQAMLVANRAVIESLLWSGLWTACCACRYCPGELMRLVREFNILHRRIYRCAGLALAERHWVNDTPLAPESPFYWHFEIAKQWMVHLKHLEGAHVEKSFSVDEVEELYSQLLLSSELTHAGRQDKARVAALERDYNWMRDSILAGAPLAQESYSYSSAAQRNATEATVNGMGMENSAAEAE